MESAPPVIRMGHPLAFGAFLEHVGAPVERHLRAQGLPAYCDNPDDFVPLRAAWSFYDATARDLLQNQSLRIGDVSRLVGFEDPPHFTRMFRRVAGVSPRQFRSHLQPPSASAWPTQMNDNAREEGD